MKKRKLNLCGNSLRGHEKMECDKYYHRPLENITLTEDQCKALSEYHKVVITTADGSIMTVTINK